MIVCDDHFLNDESMLKAMLRVFEKRTIRIFRFKSISWIALSLSFRREARDVCVCVCVCLCVLDERECEWKASFSEKIFLFVEFRNFYLLRSILELIIRSLVNIKKEKRSLFRWQNSKIQIYICVSSYRKIILLVIIFDQISNYFILF
jgi:hypothetical protein